MNGILSPAQPTATPQPLRAIQAHPAEGYVRVAWSPDGIRLIISGYDGAAEVWEFPD